MLFQYWKLFLLSLCLVVAADDSKTKLANTTIERTVQLRTHSLFAPYIDQDLQNRWWDFGGDAYVNTNKHIRLTQNRPSETGWLWSRLPISSSNWVMDVEFKVSGYSTHLYGDGMAIWITKERAKPGPAFGNQNPFTGLGIFLDTYANARHTYAFPRIMAIKGDGNTPYSIETDGDKQALGSCAANFRQTNVPTKLKITFVKDKFLNVKLQYKAYDEWMECFTIPKLTIPPSPYVGFTAATGDVSDAHDIVSVSTHSAILSREDAQRDSMKSFMGAQSSSSFLSFFIKLALFAGICAGGYYGFQVYKSRQTFGGSGNFGGPPSSRFGGMGMGGMNNGAMGMGGSGGGGGGYGGFAGGNNFYGGGPPPSAGMYDSKRAY